MEATDAAGTKTEATSERRFEHVLVVEDETPLRMVIRRNLERRGVHVREASTAREALARLSDDSPDLLLLDINLPDRTGWDVLREIRRHGPIPVTAVISAVRVSPERLAEFGVAAFLPKPFPIDALIRLVAGEESDA